MLALFYVNVTFMTNYKEENKYLEDCLSKSADGDIEAFEALYNKTKGVVYNVALSYVKNAHDAEDIMHDVYIKVFEKAGEYVALGKPYAWILTITKTIAIKWIRVNQKIINYITEE